MPVRVEEVGHELPPPSSLCRPRRLAEADARFISRNLEARSGTQTRPDPSKKSQHVAKQTTPIGAVNILSHNVGWPGTLLSGDPRQQHERNRHSRRSLHPQAGVLGLVPVLRATRQAYGAAVLAAILDEPGLSATSGALVSGDMPLASTMRNASKLRRKH